MAQPIITKASKKKKRPSDDDDDDDDDDVGEPVAVPAPKAAELDSSGSSGGSSKRAKTLGEDEPKARAGQPLPVVSDAEIAASNTKEVRHEVAVPPNYPFKPLADHVPPEKPAREYPFTLDPFQKWSIACIERGESVLVSAHTSAGKTVIAEYAIALSLKNKQRVIYTSPIKALSNQKYRELYEDFQDVGLMTGDVTINPTASCLVMTTEILRNMLYRGSEVMREVAWVVFDEIHYMRDKERGVVWEESIIMLPKTVHHVFLSATIPNAREFAEWICKVHEQPCHVVYTDYRPTPLQHYMFPSGGDGIYLVMDERSKLREDNFTKALAMVQDAPAKGGKGGRKGGPSGGNRGPSDIYKIIKMIMERNYQPVIVFAFSKRECENLGQQMAKLDFNTEEEKAMVEAVFQNAIDSLSEDDKSLPQIEAILPLLKQGIGIHHGGLLPILKEVIEIMFQEGLLKALFATETFAMGLNMPARTVVFTSVRKFDGKDFRWVSSGEYTQMAGRAGRRGLDDRGIVIQMVDERMDPAAARKMLTNGADNLTSAFHLSYNMILNLMRIEDISPEYLLERSFFQFQNNASVPALELQLKEMEAKRDEMVIENEEGIAEIHLIKHQLSRYAEDVRTVVNHPSFSVPFMSPGRLVRVRDGTSDYGWGCVVAFQKRSSNSKEKDAAKTVDANVSKYVVDVLLNCEPSAPGAPGSAKVVAPAKPGEKGEMQVVPVMLSSLDGISSIRVYLSNDLRPLENRQSVYKAVQEVKKRFKEAIPLLDPVDDMKVEDDGFKKLLGKMETLEKRLKEHPLAKSAQLPSLYAAYEAKAQLNAEIKTLKKSIRQATSIMQMEELKCRKRVLRRLGYTTASDVIEMKGRVACEISTGDELLLTEMIFNGAFNDLTVEQTVSMLSCFVFDEKSEEQPRLRDELAGPLRLMQEAARRIAKVSQESKLVIDEEQYVASFRSELMDVVYQWCKGAKFSQVISMTDIFEGSIIRAIRRLEELLRQMCSAAKAIGNTELESKFTAGIALIKRDIIFAASLYL